MQPNLPKIQDIDLKNKIVLVRVDHNVVKKGKIKGPYRIDETMKTLLRIAIKGGKPILMTHVGRPKNKKTGEINASDSTSTTPIVAYLWQKYGIDMKIPEYEVSGADGIKSIAKSVKPLVEKLKNDEFDGIYLPNTRWFAGEEAKDEKADNLAKELASLADVYVNDAFGSWQPHVSTAKIVEHRPSCAGMLMQNEINNLEKVLHPDRPFLAAVAGAKFDTKIEPLKSIFKLSDHLILGGIIYNAFLAAKYGFKIYGVEEEDIEAAKKFIEYTEQFDDKLIEPPFIIESDTLNGKEEGKYRIRDVRKLPKGTELNYVLDVAPQSFEDETIRAKFLNADNIFVNAVMGLAPHFLDGTATMYKLIDENQDAYKMYGGGDTLQELKNLLPRIYLEAINSPRYKLFTGGGAVLKAIQEQSPYGLPPVKAMLESK